MEKKQNKIIFIKSKLSIIQKIKNDKIWEAELLASENALKAELAALEKKEESENK